MTDEQQIRDLIERWAIAVHDGDLAAVLAGHADGIVMFDVPPPEQGVRGIDAYRGTWPGFLRVAGLRRGLRDRVASRDGRRGHDRVCGRHAATVVTGRTLRWSAGPIPGVTSGK
jgi:hypothetical protein